MAKQPTEAALRAAKDAKQKKLLLLLIPAFLALVVWQGPKTYNSLRGGSPPLPSATPTTTAPAPTGTTTTTAPVPGGEGVLPDTDPQPDPLDGQLYSFSRFAGRDPFVPLAPSGGSGPSSGSGATVQVNGTSEDVDIGGSFPASDPTFRLVSVSASAATIGLVSGSFANGDETITINVGETLVLVADDGARYAIKLVGVAG
jgi:hypothetical protein